MSHKCSSTKGIKRTKKLLARQNFYDHVLEKVEGYHRPGGTAVRSDKLLVIFLDVKDAVERLEKLGFGDFNLSKKTITLNGNLSLGICQAADYLVNHCNWKFSKVVQNG